MLSVVAATWWLRRGWQADAGLGDFVRIVELSKEVEILPKVLRI